jgi:hypothetical protein
MLNERQSTVRERTIASAIQDFTVMLEELSRSTDHFERQIITRDLVSLQESLVSLVYNFDLSFTDEFRSLDEGERRTAMAYINPTLF